MSNPYPGVEAVLDLWIRQGKIDSTHKDALLAEVTDDLQKTNLEIATRQAETDALNAEEYETVVDRVAELKIERDALCAEAKMLRETQIEQNVQVVLMTRKIEGMNLQVDEMQKRIYKIGLLCDKVLGLEHGFCPDVGEPRDNLTRIKIALDGFIKKPSCEEMLPLGGGGFQRCGGELPCNCHVSQSKKRVEEPQKFEEEQCPRCTYSREKGHICTKCGFLR
jgi:hypothetical protein